MRARFASGVPLAFRGGFAEAGSGVTGRDVHLVFSGPCLIAPVTDLVPGGAGPMNSGVQSRRPLIKEDATYSEPPKAVGAEVLEIRRVRCVLTESLFRRLLRTFCPEQRKEERISTPSLVGYLGTVRATKPYDVADISLSGFCLLTDERWTEGTEMPVTFKRTEVAGDIDAECFTVQATVVRCAKGSVGFSIVLSENESKAAYGNPLRVRWMGKSEMEGILKVLRAKQQDSSASIAINY
jgi:PilZ domain